MSAVTATASRGVYVPPYATGATTAATATKATGISFASVAHTGAATAGGASGTATATTTAVIVDSTGGVDSSSLLNYFTRPYLDAHTLSIPTWRYAYILWIIIAGTLVCWSAAYHLSGSGHGGSAMGAWFRKYSIRRIAVGGKVKRKDAEGGEKRVVRSKIRFASPTYAQMATIIGLIGVALCLSFVGPDYIAPTTCVFGGECGYSGYQSGGPPKTTYSAKKRSFALPSWNFIPIDPLDGAIPPINDYTIQYKHRRELNSPNGQADPLGVASPPPPSPAHLGYATQRKRGVNNPNGWAPFNDPLLASSNIDIEANYWTAAARLGLISYAMLPLAITLAVKQWPFNIWASPFLTNYHFDKTAILHRWSGRVIWLFASGHVGAWFYQLAIDKDPFGRPVLVPVWQWFRFVAGAVAYVLLTIITLFSFKAVRNRYYEFFYWSHIVLVILFLAACIIHHRPLMWWPIIAAVWWGAERFIRFLVFLHINGFTRGIGFRVPRNGHAKHGSAHSFSVNNVEKAEGYSDQKSTPRYPPSPYDESAEPLAQGQYYGQDYANHNYPPSSPTVPRVGSHTPAPSYHHSPSPSYAVSRTRQLPPPGFASAQLLPGRTVRLTINTVVPLRWRPGQHVFLSIPAVRLFEAHPYTIVSIDDRAQGIAPLGGNAALKRQGSEIVMLIRAQKGFSKALWDHVGKARKEKEIRGAGAEECAKGINLRALVSWPLGSSARVSWDSYESLLIVCGGTGVTFGMSVLEYTCRRMARRDHDGGKYKTTRVRFVWILREFAHLSWVAPTLRRCLDMLDPSRLQIDLFVSRDAPRPPRRSRRQQSSSHFQQPYPSTADDFAPPQAPFARQARPQSSQSLDSDMSDFSDAEDDAGASSTAPSNVYTQNPEYEEQIDSVTDLVLFDGEDDERTAGEVEMSSKVRSAGKIRRALSRKKTKRAQGGNNLGARPQLASTQSDLSTFGSEQDVGYSSLSGAAGARHPSPYNRADSSFAQTGSFADLNFAGADDHQSEIQSLAGSSRHLVGSGGGKRSSGGEDVKNEDFDFLDVTEEDQEDLDVVAELAKPGYPKLKEIMGEEIDRSTGKTMVACCGPNGLNTLIRHLVSDRIDLAKVVKGDPRGQVSLTCEDFSF